jgi:hypothetical protein
MLHLKQSVLRPLTLGFWTREPLGRPAAFETTLRLYRLVQFSSIAGRMCAAGPATNAVCERRGATQQESSCKEVLSNTCHLSRPS